MPSTSLEMDSRESPAGFRAAFRDSWIYLEEPLDFRERLLAPCAQTGFLDGCSWILDLGTMTSRVLTERRLNLCGSVLNWAVTSKTSSLI